jgi:hypothetical protein
MPAARLELALNSPKLFILPIKLCQLNKINEKRVCLVKDIKFKLIKLTNSNKCQHQDLNLQYISPS